MFGSTRVGYPNIHFAINPRRSIHKSGLGPSQRTERRVPHDLSIRGCPFPFKLEYSGLTTLFVLYENAEAATNEHFSEI